MKFFAVYIKTDAEAPLETVKCVGTKFSFIAGIFQGFWALYHRIWWLAALLIAIEAMLGYARVEQWLDGGSIALVNLAIFAVVGFSANDWQEANLRHKGYTLMNVLVARNEMEAKARFFAQYSSKKQQHSLQVAQGIFA